MVAGTGAARGLSGPGPGPADGIPLGPGPLRTSPEPPPRRDRLPDRAPWGGSRAREGGSLSLARPRRRDAPARRRRRDHRDGRPAVPVSRGRGDRPPPPPPPILTSRLCLTGRLRGARLAVMSARRALVLLLLACLFCLTPPAYASPPDPTWVDGFFDDDDGDDVVIAISWAAWAVDLDPLAVATPLFASVSFLPVGEPELASIAPRPVFLGRAPPVA